MSYRFYIYFGFAVSVGLLVMMFGWAGVTPLSGAVVASGVIASEGQVKDIQHLDGGIVQEILVEDGDLVNEGQILMRLDATQLQARMDILQNRYYRAVAEQARLEAERDGKDYVTFPAVFTKHSYLLAPSLKSTQEELFVARKQALSGEEYQLKQQIKQIQNQEVGQKNLIKTKERQLSLIEEELKGVEDLHEKGYAPYTRLLSLRREQASIEGEIAEHKADIARMESSIGEIKIKIIQSKRQYLEQVLSDLKDVTSEINEVSPEVMSLKEQIKRLTIVSPVKGYVHELTAHTKGGVVTAATPIMRIVPAEDKLVIRSRVLPQDIDQIHRNQQVIVKLSAFDQRKTPDLLGVVAHRSADHIIDPSSQMSYYTVQVDIPLEELQKLSETQVLVSGMPAEAYIQTEPRTALNYILKPFLDEWDQALQEQ